MALGGVGFFATGFFHIDYWHVDYFLETQPAVVASTFDAPLHPSRLY